VATRVHLSVTLVLRVGLHLCRAGEITRPHHHHPRIAKKSFSRLSSLLTVSLSSLRLTRRSPRNLRADAAGSPWRASDWTVPCREIFKKLCLGLVEMIPLHVGGCRPPSVGVD
ncbi:unnamed protein product, partial [Urochloa humidicola]